MVPNFLNSASLLANAEENNLYVQIVAQLEKDFALANIALELPFKVSPKNLITILHQKVYHLMMERFTEYLNLLYIIDVPEKMIKEIKAIDIVEISNEVSFLILKREFQKVWYKKKYA